MTHYLGIKGIAETGVVQHVDQVFIIVEGYVVVEVRVRLVLLDGLCVDQLRLQARHFVAHVAEDAGEVVHLVLAPFEAPRHVVSKLLVVLPEGGELGERIFLEIYTYHPECSMSTYVG